MKTMISMDGKRIWRTTDEKASELYIRGEANYTTKSVWKEKVRDVEKPKDEKTKEVKKANKMSKSAKRHMRKANK